MCHSKWLCICFQTPNRFSIIRVVVAACFVVQASWYSSRALKCSFTKRLAFLSLFSGLAPQTFHRSPFSPGLFFFFETFGVI